MSLETVEEIERAIGALSPSQIEDLYERLERKFPSALDTCLPSDIAAGRLDKAIFRALDDEANDRLRSL
jgi:hypothetical protein